MSCILSVLTFPWVALVLWNKNDLYPHPRAPQHSTPQPVAFAIHQDPKPACEYRLPILWDRLSVDTHLINTVVTLGEPGPFTATRAGQAFAQGLSQGDPKWDYFSVSLFDVFEPSIKEISWLDTGGNHWVNHQGDIISNTTPLHHTVSSQTCTISDVWSWSKAMALMCDSPQSEPIHS